MKKVRITRRQLFKATGAVTAGLMLTSMPGKPSVAFAQPSKPPMPAMPMKRITPAERKAAAIRAKQARTKAAANRSLVARAAVTPAPGGTPDYFGPYPNYANSPQATYPRTQITVTDSTGSGAVLTPMVIPTIDKGVIGFTGLAGGSGYVTPPTVLLVGGGGYGATAVAVMTGASVSSLVVTAPGTGYLTPPTVVFTGGGGSGAAATSVLGSGALAAIAVDDGGAGYTAPTITITGGGATTNATATATINAEGAITLVTLTSPGAGYGVLVNNGTLPTGVPGIRKFVDSLPGLGAAGANNLGNYIPVAVPDTTTYPGCDYYEIELGEFTQKMHSDLPPTTVRGYRQTNGGDTTFHYLGPLVVAQQNRPVRVKFTNRLPTGAGGNLFIPADTTIMGAGMGPAGQVTAIKILVPGSGYTTQPQVIIAAPTTAGGVRATATAYIRNGSVYEVAVTNPGSGYTAAPSVVIAAPATGTRAISQAVASGAMGGNYTQNRASVHLHGGDTIWISDGTAHQWITPAGENTPYPKGVNVHYVPDMPSPGDGSVTLFYSNGQSARLMFYHDHAYGITRLNVYAGEAAGYLLTDPIEQTLITGGTITPPGGAPVTVTANTVPGNGIPLVIQDKTFVDATRIVTPLVPDPVTGIVAQDPTWNWGVTPGTPHTGDLWFPHVYMPNQNPWDMSGASAMGRWDYGPWFWPPFTGLTHGPVPNPYYDPTLPNPEPALIPGIPNPSIVPEGFMDTMLVNGQAYPYVTVQPQAYRFRILNACNDRSLNLQLYKAKSNAAMWSGTTLADANAGEVGMVPATPNSGLPARWPTDGRDGGVPDPMAIGPNWIQIGSEGGLLPAPAVIPPTPVGYVYNRRDIVVLNVSNKCLFLGPAERADVIVDFSQFAGQTLILYNDAPAPVPAFDPRLDYYTGVTDQTDSGGAPSTVPGYGPNTRTIMQIQVAAVTPQPAYNLTALRAALPAAFAASQPQIIVPQAAYNAAYGKTFPTDAFVRIQDTYIDFINGPLTAVGIVNGGSGYAAGTTVSISGGGGTGATATPVISNGAVRSITLTAGGSGFVTPPNVTIAAPPAGGRQAKAVAYVASGAVTSVLLLDGGAGYTAAPAVTFSGGGGAGAVATTVIGNGVVSAITLTSGGTGYTSAPTITVTGAGTGASLRGLGVHMGLLPKAIQELFDPDYGRMNAILGVEVPNTTMINQTTIPFYFLDPASELYKASASGAPIGSLGDGTQIWKITHNGVDTHAIHFHLFNVQLINRVGWDGAIRGPDANEVGWKDTVRMNPLEDAIVAFRPVQPTIPSGWVVPSAIRLLDPTTELGAVSGFSGVDTNNNPVTVTNKLVNYGWEYTWHCHLLGHEENDMMRPTGLAIPPAVAPTNLVASGAAGPLRVVLTWTNGTPSYNTTNYSVQRATDAAFTQNVTTFLTNGITNTYTDTTVAANTTYYFRVTASNVIGSSVPGYPMLSADTAPTNTVVVGPPAAPTMIGAAYPFTNPNPPRIASVRVQWTDNSPSAPNPPNFNAESGFYVGRAEIVNNVQQAWVPLQVVGSPVPAAAGTGTTVSFYDSGARRNRTFVYHVRATNVCGNSAWSAQSAPVTTA